MSVVMLGKTTRSGRSVKLTPRMMEFLELASKGDTAKKREELLNKTGQVETLLSLDQVQAQEIQEKYDEILEEQSKLFEMEEEEAEPLNVEEKEVYLDYFSDETTEIVDKTEIIKTFLAQNDVKPEDSVSQTGTNLSKTSVRSQKEAIIEEKTRQAEIEFEKLRLLQQAELDRERQKLEELRKQLEQKEKIQQLDRELELSKVKVEIMSQVGSDCSRVSRNKKRPREDKGRADDSKRRNMQQEVKTSSPQRGYVPPRFEYTNGSKKYMSYDGSHEPTQVDNVFTKLANAIDRNSRQTVQIEPEVFCGDVMSYGLWRRCFEELVELDVKPERRFIYLLRYTKGEARECIDNLTHLDSQSAYQEGMKMLEDRYGDQFVSYEALRDKLDNWPYVKDNDGPALRKFADFLSTCLAAMQTNASLKILDSMPENHKLLRKLPRRLVDKWGNKVDEWQYGGKQSEQSHEYPPFFMFVDFMKKQARIELGPVKRMMNREYNRNKAVRVHLTDVEEPEELECYATGAAEESSTCSCCGASHDLTTCSKFAGMTIEQRIKFSYDKQLCRGCLNPGHFAWSCKNVQRCTTCHGRHHVLFHDDNFVAKTRSSRDHHARADEKKEKKVVLSTKVDDDNVTAHIVLADIGNSKIPGLKKRVYVVIDNQSNACFVAQDVANDINAVGKKTNVELHTMAGVEDIVLDKVEDLTITSKTGDATIALPPTYVKNGMETGYDQIPTPDDVKKWKHLQKIWHLIDDVDKSIPVGLLIGRNCYRATKLTDFIPSSDAEPYAVCTSLGWGIVGRLQQPNTSASPTVWVHTVNAVESSPAKFFDSYTVDFQNQHSVGKLSQDDVRFIKCLDEGMIRNEDGRVMMPLPMKTKGPVPDNAAQAKASLNGLKKKFQKDASYKKKFVAKMEELFVKGYAEPAPATKTEGRTFHLTYHGVFHPKKVDELRVVFNGARKFMGFVLNEILLQGPDQTNNLYGVFCRFRKELVTLTCDIEAMFYQVLVVPDDRDFLRFFWWPNGDTDQEPQEFRMMVHIFGATSSPGVAAHTLRKIADTYEEKYGTETVEFIKDGFYVDDGVTCTNTDDKAITLMKSSRGLCSEGKFNLTKFSSNRHSVVEQIPMEIRAKNLKELDMVRDKLPKGYTLGIFLCNEDDCI